MNNISIDGFKRRAGLNLSSHQIKSIQASQLQIFQNQNNLRKNNKQRKTQRCLDQQCNKQNKFSRLRNNSIQSRADLLNHYRHETQNKSFLRQSFTQQFNQNQKLDSLIQNLKPRGSGIYKFGFRSYQKTNKKIFCQVFNILPSKMKGTMHIGELWSNHQTSKFIKSNKIYTNKIKLIEKLKQAKKQLQKQQNSLSGDEGFTNITISTNHIINYSLKKTNSQTKFSNKSLNYTNLKELNSTMSSISKNLSTLKKTQNEKNKSQLKYLEFCNRKMQRLEDKYLQRMLEIN